MIKINTLNRIDYETIEKFGFNGFMTDFIYQVTHEICGEELSFNIKKIALKNTYVKEWKVSQESLENDNKTLEEGLSFAAYSQGNLVGILIVSNITWNNSLWIENIRVSDCYRQQGIAKKMLDTLKEIGKTKGYRLIGLEVMASNYPAIELYKKCGYKIDGVDMSHYPTQINGEKEVALFMKYYLLDLI